MVQYLHHPACKCEADYKVCLDKERSWPPKDFTKEEKKRWRAIRKKQYFKKYYQNNTDKIKESAAIWFEENTERKRSMMRITNNKVNRLKARTRARAVIHLV